MSGGVAPAFDAAGPGGGPAPSPKRWRLLRGAVGLGARVALILIAAEIVVRLSGYRPPDLRPRVALFPRFPDIYSPQRDLGWVLKPDLDWKGGDVATPFRTDAFGHRAHGDRPPPAGDGATVDCIGDSSTFGYGVPNDATYPARLEALLRESTGDASLRVRNLGVPGYTAYEARLLAERDGPHAPVTLVWVGFNDHFGTLPSHTRARSLLRRRIAYACFRSSACALFFDWLTRRPADAPPPALPVPPSYTPDVSPDEYVAQLTRAVRRLRAAGSEPILLIYPPLDVDEEVRRAAAEYWKRPRDQIDANIDAHPTYQRLTREVAERERVRVVELPPLFEAGGNRALHFDWVHPNARGQEVIAKAVEPVVRDALAARGKSDSPAIP
ncbi:MAG TPA: SGNH/GDSL hydrolase family protein [Candidatus Binatia bacterium]|nr:SGNH/GDSL hydrolase family protein [Candidatus Binatia bacterium]